MTNKITIAGAGGQGNLLMGKLLCEAALKEGKHATWYPSYGPLMRSGKSTCTVVVSDEEIGSPIVLHPDILIVMNKPSLCYLVDLKQGGLAIINQSLAQYSDNSDGNTKNIVLLFVNEMLKEAKIGVKIANMALLGALLKKCPVVKLESVLEILETMLLKKDKSELFELDKKALMLGYNYCE